MKQSGSRSDKNALRSNGPRPGDKILTEWYGRGGGKIVETGILTIQRVTETRIYAGVARGSFEIELRKPDLHKRPDGTWYFMGRPE
ncbi:MAG: hypothetical protein HQ592_00845 [Planctomycetes bacterium]|jgi:hypothetical protein|nr:hypothetical protein [Planctomycetota bacterium]